MSIFYTGKGDKGKSYVGKQKVDKTCVEIEALGALDELNSLLGLVKSHDVSKETKAYLHNAQENLFIIQAHIASKIFRTKFAPPKFPESAIKEMEKLIRAFEKKIKPARKFVIPGAGSSSAWLDYARAVARRAERSVLLLHKKTLRKAPSIQLGANQGKHFRYGSEKKIAPEILAYLNRLSSLLFALARFETKKKKQTEKHPNYK